jgi:hypothetical protein
METLLFVISLCPKGENLFFEWENELKIKGRIDTFFDTTNGLDERSEDFKRFQAIAFYIEEILLNNTDKNIKPESLIEISNNNLPSSLYSKDNILIWSQQKVGII